MADDWQQPQVETSQLEHTYAPNLLFLNSAPLFQLVGATAPFFVMGFVKL